MPQATDRQRALMEKWFHLGFSDWGPTGFLLAHGYTERAGLWSKPTPAHTPSACEVECLLFLRDEWDHDFARPLFPPLESDI